MTFTETEQNLGSSFPEVIVSISLLQCNYVTRVVKYVFSCSCHILMINFDSEIFSVCSCTFMCSQKFVLELLFHLIFEDNITKFTSSVFKAKCIVTI